MKLHSTALSRIESTNGPTSRVVRRIPIDTCLILQNSAVSQYTTDTGQLDTDVKNHRCCNYPESGV